MKPTSESHNTAAGLQGTIIPPESLSVSNSNRKLEHSPAFILTSTRWMTATKRTTVPRRSFLTRLLLGVCSCQWSALLSYEKRESLSDADAVLRRYTLQMTFLSLLGTGLVVVHNDLCFDPMTLIFYDNGANCPLGQHLLWVNIIISALFVHRLVLYYHCRSYIQMKEWHLASRWKAFIESNLIYFFVFELVVAVWQPFPGLQHIYGLGHMVVIMLMVFRLYLLVRLLRDFSPAHIHRRRIKSEFETQNKGFHTNIRVDTVLKTQFYSHTQLTILGVFFTMVISMAYVIYILERQFWVSHSGGLPILGSEWVKLTHSEKQFYSKTVLVDYTNCIWFVTVTATTVGYGDITPQTGPARIAAVASAIGGIVTTSLLVSVLTNRLAPTPFQQYVIDYLNRSAIRRRKREVAAVIVQTWWKMVKTNRMKRPRQASVVELRKKSSLISNGPNLLCFLLMPSLTEFAVMLSNVTRYHSAIMEFQSLKSREAQMKSSGAQDVTEFQGLTRAILSEQLEMRRTIQYMQEMMQRMSKALETSGAIPALDKVEEISIPTIKDDNVLRNRKRDSNSSVNSDGQPDSYLFYKRS